MKGVPVRPWTSPHPGLGLPSINAELGLRFPKLLRRLHYAFSTWLPQPLCHTFQYTGSVVGPGVLFNKYPR